MSSSYITPDDLIELLKNKQTFILKSKFLGWYIFYIILIIFFGTLIYLFLSSLGILFFIFAILGVSLYIRNKMAYTLILSSESIDLQKNQKTTFKCQYNDIFNVEFFVRTTVVDNVPSSENFFKIITRNGRTKEITADRWKTPRPLPSDNFIKTIISFYYNLNNQT